MNLDLLREVQPSNYVGDHFQRATQRGQQWFQIDGLQERLYIAAAIRTLRQTKQSLFALVDEYAGMAFEALPLLRHAAAKVIKFLFVDFITKQPLQPMPSDLEVVARNAAADGVRYGVPYRDLRG